MMSKLAAADFGIDYKEIFSLAKLDIAAITINLITREVDNFDDMGLVDPLTDDRSILQNLMKVINTDRFEDEKEVYYKTGKTKIDKPRLCMYMPSEEFTKKIIRAISSQKEDEHPQFFLQKFGF